MTLSPTVEVNVICHLGRPWCPATCSLDVFPHLENKRPPDTEIQSPEEMLHTIKIKDPEREQGTSDVWTVAPPQNCLGR